MKSFSSLRTLIRLMSLWLLLAAGTQAQTLVSYYSFDYATLNTSGGNILGAIASGGVNSETLTPLGTAPTVDPSGRFGQAANFSGAAGLDTNGPWGLGATTLGSSFSISFWMKMPDVTSNAQTYIFQTGASSGAPQNAVLFGYDAGKVELYSTTGPNPQMVSGMTLSSTLNNTWFNIVYTYDGANFLGYLNGVQQFAFNSSLNLAANGGLSIGSARNGAAVVPGSLDDFAIWSGALSASQVADLQSAPVLAAVPEPSAYAALFGVAALGIAACRRQTRRAAA